MKPSTETVNQELKDFKETYHIDIQEIKITLGQILAQARATNGRVTKVETLQTNCPAREAFKMNNRISSLNNWIAFGAMLISLLALFVIVAPKLAEVFLN